MHTTEQAKTSLWCPMIRVGVMPQAGGPASCNDPTSSFSGTCIADRCAMWRWRQSSTNNVLFTRVYCRNASAKTEPERPLGLNPALEFVPHDPDAQTDAYWIEPLASRNARRPGFCGLAGRPEFA